MHDFNRVLSVDVFSKLLVFESSLLFMQDAYIQSLGMLFPFVFITILQEVHCKSSGVWC